MNFEKGDPPPLIINTINVIAMELTSAYLAQCSYNRDFYTFQKFIDMVYNLKIPRTASLCALRQWAETCKGHGMNVQFHRGQWMGVSLPAGKCADCSCSFNVFIWIISFSARTRLPHLSRFKIPQQQSNAKISWHFTTIHDLEKRSFSLQEWANWKPFLWYKYYVYVSTNSS